MAYHLVFIISADDQSDLDWIRSNTEGAIQEVIDENEDRFDSEVELEWTWTTDRLVERMMEAG